MIRLVVFDFDGTLVDSNGVKERCLQSTAASVPHGAELLPAIRAAGGNRYHIFAELARQSNPEAAPKVAAALGRNLAAAYTRCCLKALSPQPSGGVRGPP